MLKPVENEIAHYATLSVKELEYAIKQKQVVIAHIKKKQTPTESDKAILADSLDRLDMYLEALFLKKGK